MTITQTVEIPPNRWLNIEAPREVPTGPVILTWQSPMEKPSSTVCVVEDVRRLLQKEMAEQGTYEISAAAGDGWGAHVRERYAEP